jgi:DNA-binding MarR family transcriptional regulator
VSSDDRSREALMAALESALREVSGVGVLFSNAAAERLGLNPTDLECLGYLAGGPISAGALAAATGLTTGAITGVIDRLERAGFARREPDPNDRRKVLVRETDEARARTAPIFAPMAAASAAALAGYSDAELKLLLGFLEKSRDAGLEILARLRQGGAAFDTTQTEG